MDTDTLLGLGIIIILAALLFGAVVSLAADRKSKADKESE